MISSIEVSRAATYGEVPQVLSDLSQFNYVFGPNGSGKTTISRIIADPGAFPHCRLEWQRGVDLESLVYNRNWIGRNFDEPGDLQGVFTLGEGHLSTLRAIEAEKKRLDSLGEKREGIRRNLRGEDGEGGKEGELAALEEEIKKTCWAQKQKHDAHFSGPFTGLRNNADLFRQRVFQERATNAAVLQPFDELKAKAETVFGETPTKLELIAAIDSGSFTSYEAAPVLKKKVVGKEDVDLATMIERLGNSDWVREGRVFFEENDGVCPFCQQPTPEGLEKSLSDYFDETFEADVKAIGSLEASYQTDAERVQDQLQKLIDSPSEHLEATKLEAAKAKLDRLFSKNLQTIQDKRKEPSRSVELGPVSGLMSEIQSLIDAANVLIRRRNALVANLSNERVQLTAQVWRYLLDVELKASLEAYDTRRADLQKAIDGLNASFQDAERETRLAERRIAELEQQITSIQPTIDGINSILRSFGFTTFALAMAENQTHYKIVRQDGVDAKETLSEGERSFVTFLYFFHLLKGSVSESGITRDRVVVFDDPVSSLDAEVLFVVSSLIRSVIDDVRNVIGVIRQVFLLTHNVYFHKEVTFNTRRRDSALREETFWTVRRLDSVSMVKKHPGNPVSTCYEMLWGEVRSSDRSTLTIQNTLRRVLEYYFQILGGVDPDEICGKFEGKERLICRSLFSWVNAGSHHAHDDIYVASDETGVNAFLGVFKAIFEKQGHENHYNMMMGIQPYSDEQEVTSAEEATNA